MHQGQLHGNPVNFLNKSEYKALLLLQYTSLSHRVLALYSVGVSVHVSVWVHSSHLCFQLIYFEPLLVGFSFQGQAVHVSVRTLEFFTLQLVTHTWSI